MSSITADKYVNQRNSSLWETLLVICGGDKAFYSRFEYLNEPVISVTNACTFDVHFKAPLHYRLILMALVIIRLLNIDFLKYHQDLFD